MALVSSLVMWYRKDAWMLLLRSPNPETSTLPPTLVIHSGLGRCWATLGVTQPPDATIAQPVPISRDLRDVVKGIPALAGGYTGPVVLRVWSVIPQQHLEDLFSNAYSPFPRP